MDRRDFLKTIGLAGASVIAPISLSSEADSTGPYEGPLYFFFNAIGGWDTTCLCDPKGTAELNRSFTAAGIQAAGNIAYAPMAANERFFRKYYSELLVLNGMDMSSPNHAVGQRYMWTGKIDSKRYPAFGALIAGARAPAAAMSFLSFGEYDATGDLVPLSRIQSKDQLLDVLDPGAIEGQADRRYHERFAADHIQEALRARHARRAGLETLPRRRAARSTLYTGQLAADSIRRMREFLPAEMPVETNPRGLRGASTMAIAAMRAGLCVSANFPLAVFDSHDDNDAKQAEGLDLLLSDVDFAIEAADAAGLRDRLTIVIGSDFGRTPRYNAADGKDHWSVGSALVMGPGIRGNRVIGGTDGGLEPLRIDPETLAATSRDDGVRLRPEHLHHSLRRHAGVAESAGADRYPLLEEPLDLFA